MQSSRLFSCFSFFDLNISDIKVCLHCRFSSVKAWKLTGDGWKFKAPWKCFWVVCLEIPDNVAGCCAWLGWSGPGLQLLNNNLRSLWFVNTEISSSRRLGWAWSKCWSGRKSCNQESRFWFYSDCFEKLTNAKPIWWGEARLARLPLHKHLLQYYRGVSSMVFHPPGARRMLWWLGKLLNVIGCFVRTEEWEMVTQLWEIGPFLSVWSARVTFLLRKLYLYYNKWIH